MKKEINSLINNMLLKEAQQRVMIDRGVTDSVKYSEKCNVDENMLPDGILAVVFGDQLFGSEAQIEKRISKPGELGRIFDTSTMQIPKEEARIL